MVLGSTQPLTEMSTRNNLWGGGLWRPVRRAGLTIFMWRLILKSGSLNFLKPSGPLERLLFAFQPTQLNVMEKKFLFSTITLHTLYCAPSWGTIRLLKKEEKRILCNYYNFHFCFLCVRSRTFHCYYTVSSVVLNYTVVNSIDKKLGPSFFLYTPVSSVTLCEDRLE